VTRAARRAHLRLVDDRDQLDNLDTALRLIAMRRRGYTVTPAGIAIGCAYTPAPRREIGSQAEIVQSAMLRPRKQLPSVEPERLVVEVGSRPLWWRAWRALLAVWRRA